jgi:2Fe-2S ferredoxin
VSPRVRVEPAGIELTAEPGETVMAAAVRSGYRWPTVCGGLADCGVCVLEVLAAPEPLVEPGAEEAARLAVLPELRHAPDRNYRLACRLVVVDGLSVRKRGVVRSP